MAQDETTKGTVILEGLPAEYDAQGKRVTGTAGAAHGAAVAASVAAAKACLHLYNGPSVAWSIDVTFNPNTYPFTVTGGSIKGTICGSGSWVVTGGSIGPTLLIHATRPSGGGCSTLVTIVGNYQNPSSYAGTYGFNGASGQFTHTTLYCCGACP